MAAQYPVSFWVTIMPALLPHASCSIAGIFRLPSSSSCLLLPSSVAIAGSSCLLWKWGDVLHTKMATQGTRFHLSAWEAAAAWFSTCPNCRAHTAFMSNSLIYQEWNLLLATVGIHQQAMQNMAMVESELLGEICVSDAFCPLLSALRLVFEEWCVEVHCTADVERLPLGAGVQGRQVIFLS